MTEAVVVGRIGVDLTPSRPRTSLAAADGFIRAVGGFAGNIATGLARLGVATGVVSGVGDDGHGEHVRTALSAEGVDVGAIRTMPATRTQVAFFEAWPPDRFPVTFYRPAPAPDVQLSTRDLAGDDVAGARLVIVSAALLAAEPARGALLAAIARRSAVAREGTLDRTGTLLDLDWRPTLWPEPSEYPALVERALDGCDVVIGSDDEFAAAGLRPEKAVDAGAGRSRIVVLKHGPDGASIVARVGRRRLPGIAVDVVCGLGAGDALTAAFGAGLLAGLDPLAALERGNAAGAIVASRLMCSAAMPSSAEIDAMIAPPTAATREAHA